MLHHIYKDMLSVMHYLPAGLLVGIPVAGVIILFNKMRGLKSKQGKLFPLLCFSMYFGVIMVITFFSRELGSRAGKDIDLQLFSSWGINARNNAYVIENVLLFIPYTFLYCWAYEQRRNLLACFLLGAVTSLFIEVMQLITARGVFQIDDILTNILGALVGCLLYTLLCGIQRIYRKKR